MASEQDSLSNLYGIKDVGKGWMDYIRARSGSIGKAYNVEPQTDMDNPFRRFQHFMPNPVIAQGQPNIPPRGDYLSSAAQTLENIKTMARYHQIMQGMGASSVSPRQAPIYGLGAGLNLKSNPLLAALQATPPDATTGSNVPRGVAD
jgi:hypothetical protein